MDIRAPLAALLSLGFAGLIAAAIVSGCGSDEGGTGTPDGGTDDGGLGDGWCGAFCGSNDGGMCLNLGSACTTNGDCCSNDCNAGVCSFPACTCDNQACTSGAACCSGICGSGGTCTPLNTMCKTLGNCCSADGDCCSKRCSGGTCQPSSFCGQAGDVCLSSGDCCTGNCIHSGSNPYGTCDPNPPGGPANCGLPDGMLCGGTVPDGGFAANDAGLPFCGGPCCSRACAPWGPTKNLVCQPASGCKPVGDLCTSDGQCCGSAGLPGGSGKPVTCVKTAPYPVGVCRLPMGCKPDGDVCKLKTLTCNSSCDCCAGNCEKLDTCKQDNVGVPRCAPQDCADAGGACASSASCCGKPCVPNPVDGGSPPLICWPTACVNCGLKCTTSADCCPGGSCNSSGICECSGSDGGTPPCASYGQVCTVDGDCCNGVPCTGGRCEFPPPN